MLYMKIVQLAGYHLQCIHNECVLNIACKTKIRTKINNNILLVCCFRELNMLCSI